MAPEPALTGGYAYPDHNPSSSTPMTFTGGSEASCLLPSDFDKVYINWGTDSCFNSQLPTPRSRFTSETADGRPARQSRTSATDAADDMPVMLAAGFDRSTTSQKKTGPYIPVLSLSDIQEAVSKPQASSSSGAPVPSKAVMEAASRASRAGQVNVLTNLFKAAAATNNSYHITPQPVKASSGSNTSKDHGGYSKPPLSAPMPSPREHNSCSGSGSAANQLSPLLRAKLTPRTESGAGSTTAAPGSPTLPPKHSSHWIHQVLSGGGGGGVSRQSSYSSARSAFISEAQLSGGGSRPQSSLGGYQSSAGCAELPPPTVTTKPTGSGHDSGSSTGSSPLATSRFAICEKKQPLGIPAMTPRTARKMSTCSLTGSDRAISSTGKALAAVSSQLALLEGPGGAMCGDTTNTNKGPKAAGTGCLTRKPSALTVAGTSSFSCTTTSPRREPFQAVLSSAPPDDVMMAVTAVAAVSAALAAVAAAATAAAAVRGMDRNASGRAHAGGTTTIITECTGYETAGQPLMSSFAAVAAQSATTVATQAAAAAAAAAATSTAAERSVKIQLQPSALPFLASKAIRGQPVELIITRDAVYCAEEPTDSRLSRRKILPRPISSLKKLLKDSQRRIAAAVLSKPLTPAAASTPGRTGVLLQHPAVLIAGTPAAQHLQAALTALKAVPAQVSLRAGELLKTSTRQVRHSDAARKFEAACQALKAKSLVMRGQAGQLYDHSVAVFAAIDTAGRFAAAAEKLKEASAKGTNRARQAFKRAVTLVMAAQAAQRFLKAVENLKASSSIHHDTLLRKSPFIKATAIRAKKLLKGLKKKAPASLASVSISSSSVPAGQSQCSSCAGSSVMCPESLEISCLRAPSDAAEAPGSATASWVQATAALPAAEIQAMAVAEAESAVVAKA